MHHRDVPTPHGRKPIGRYDASTHTYHKWAENSHRLWKAGGAYTIDKAYLDVHWPECTWVIVYNKTDGKHYRASVALIQQRTWRDPQGNLHADLYGEQYALPPQYWEVIPEP